MNTLDNDDDDLFDAIYDNGHWIWDEESNQLKFITDYTTESYATTSLLPAALIVGPVEFKEDLDVIEQQRFRRTIQRKSTGPDDIVMLQDVKDLVLYVAPVSLVSPTIVRILHTATTERFLRALILYCQYYLQTVETMEQRTLELKTKIPTVNSKIIESIYQENLCDLRLLVAKEYCTMLLGGDDFRKYHHMGKDKKSKSLSRKEALIFEPFIRICVQIVWIALARKQHAQIEVEINRLFRSKKFNLAEHNLKIDLEETMTPDQRQVLRGECLNHIHSTPHMRSPFFDEVECNRDVDFKMLGLGVIKYPNLDTRLRHLENLLIMPENKFPKYVLNLGIIGLKRSRFDPMLREIQVPIDSDNKSSTLKQSSIKVSPKSSSKHLSKSSNLSKKSGVSDGLLSKFFPAIYLPPQTTEPEEMKFSTENQTRLAIYLYNTEKEVVGTCRSKIQAEIKEIRTK